MGEEGKGGAHYAPELLTSFQDQQSNWSLDPDSNQLCLFLNSNQLCLFLKAPGHRGQDKYRKVLWSTKQYWTVSCSTWAQGKYHVMPGSTDWTVPSSTRAPDPDVNQLSQSNKAAPISGLISFTERMSQTLCAVGFALVNHSCVVPSLPVSERVSSIDCLYWRECHVYYKDQLIYHG